MYDEYFASKIEEISKQYGENRDEKVDTRILNSNFSKKNIYKIPENHRFNFNGSVYSIDPNGCEDADDAFSVFDNGKDMTLVIHIADPSDYINLDSKLWRDIVNRGTTYYPTNRRPIHMLPNEIVKQISLMTSRVSETKKSISLFVNVDKKTYLPIFETVQIKFCNIFVSKKNAFSYKKASEILSKPRHKLYKTFQMSVKIANAIYHANDNVGKLLNTRPVSTIRYIDSEPQFKTDTVEIYKMKNMIAQFAIYANSYIGNYLYEQFNDCGIFRICDGTKLTVSGEELLNDIVRHGIKAEYKGSSAGHDLIGIEKYSHFTSPLRRLSDIVVHYLLKFLYLKEEVNPNIKIPFTKAKLETISTHTQTISKKIRKISYEENKLRLFQIMYNTIQKNGDIEVDIIYTSYIKNRFLNVMITRIGDCKIHLSLTFKKNNLKIIGTKKKMTFKIKKMYPKAGYDNKIFPDLTEFLIDSLSI